MMKKMSKEEKEFFQTWESSVVNSCVPSFNITYEGINYSQLSPVKGEEDNWWDSYICPTYKKGGRK